MTLKNKLIKQITFEVALVIFVAMLIYAIFQYFSGGQYFFSLLIQHLLHTVILGILIYIVLLWRLRTLILDPLEQIFFHGYQMSKGIFRNRKYTRANNEMDNVTAMMNLIADHFAFVYHPSWKDYVVSIDQLLEMIRERKDIPEDVKKKLEEIRNSLQEMQITIERFIHQSALSGES